MAEKYEVLRVNFVQNLPLLLYNGTAADQGPEPFSCSADALTAGNNFGFTGSISFEIDGLDRIGELQVELKHLAGDEQLSLEFRNPGNKIFRNGFKSIEGIFQLTKDEDAQLSTRICIMDITTCNNFDCGCDRKQLCYTVKAFCRLADISKYLVDIQGGGNAGIASTFSGRISSFGGNKFPLQGIPSLYFNYTADTLPDITIKVGGKEFPTHKALLAGQSDTFLALFTIRSSEVKKGIVEMKEATVDGVKGVLNFLYKRELGIPSRDNIEIFYDMLRIAEKYNIQSLKEALVEIICLVPHEEFDLDHAIQFFIFAQRLQSRLLENKAFQVFQTKRSEIRNSKSVTSFFKENTELAEKLLAGTLS